MFRVNTSVVPGQIVSDADLYLQFFHIKDNSRFSRSRVNAKRENVVVFHA